MFYFYNIPNRILPLQWYDGTEAIDEIHFIECHIELIETDAFNVQAFRMLRYLSISHNEGLITFNEGCFNGLSRLGLFFFSNATVHDANTDVLKDIRRGLRYLFVTRIATSFNLASFLGRYRFGHLNALYFDDCTSPQFHILTPSNFSNQIMPIIDTIDFRNCDIEAILDGTFDGISKALKHLLFYRTKIKRIFLSVFQGPFEHIYWNFDRAYRMQYPLLKFDDNPIKCTCDIYFLRNALSIANSPDPINLFSCHNDETDEKNAVEVECSHFQHINWQRTCAKWHLNRIYTFIRFNIKLNNDLIVIQSNATEPFKMLINYQQMNRNPILKCFKIDKAGVKIPKSMFMEMEIVQISILYFIHGWPLSFVTIRLPDDEMNGSAIWIQIDLTVFICMIAFFFGCCLVILLS